MHDLGKQPVSTSVQAAAEGGVLQLEKETGGGGSNSLDTESPD